MLFGGLAVAALLMTLAGTAILGRGQLAERFPQTARVVCGVLACRVPPSAAFELVQVEKVWPDGGDRRVLYLEVTYRAVQPTTTRPVVDVVVFDDVRILAHAAVEIVDPRAMSENLWIAAIALPMRRVGSEVGLEVTLR